jgi:hypothetical protein
VKRLSHIILFTCLIVGCTRVSRWLDLDSGAERVSPRIPAAAPPTAPPPTPVTTSCCWCSLREAGRNVVQVYLNREACEDRSDRGPNRSCRRVEVEGDSCDLVRISRRAGRLTCIAHPLHYEDNGKRQTIQPPDDFELTCRAGKFLRDEAFKLWRDDENGTSHELPPPDTYCSCGRDPDNASTCVVTRTSPSGVTTLASAPKPAGSSGCTRQVCNTLFNQAEYRSECPTYVPGEP